MQTFQEYNGTRTDYLEYCRTSEELHAAMVRASQVADIDTALASIQALIGVTDGGFAGMFFDDFEWNNSPATVRLYRLRSYVQTEILYYVESKVVADSRSQRIMRKTAANLERFAETLPETISLDDVQRDRDLAALILWADSVANRTDRRALDWIKTQGEL